jgi:hypothetical protein
MRTRPTLIALVVVAGLAVVAASGCATLVNGTRQTVEFQSHPGNATVLVNGRYVGGTPVATRLERDRTHHVRIGLPGYLTYDMLLERKTSGWVWGNLLLGSAGLIGIVVDALSGAMYYLAPRQLEASALLGNRMTATERGSRLVVIVALNPAAQPGWQRLGCLSRSAPPAPPAAPVRELPEPPRYPSCR